MSVCQCRGFFFIFYSDLPTPSRVSIRLCNNQIGMALWRNNDQIFQNGGHGGLPLLVDLRPVCFRDPEERFLAKLDDEKGFFVISVSENVHDKGLSILSRQAPQQCLQSASLT